MPEWVQERLRNPEMPLPEFMQGLVLTGEWAWKFQEPADKLACILHLPDLLGPNCVLCVEGTHVTEEVQAFFNTHSVEKPIPIAHDTIWPISQVWQIPLDVATLEEYVEIHQKLGEGLPETAWIAVGDHLKAYRDGVMLLHWHDAFSGNQIIVSQEIPEEVVQRFCSQLQLEYSKVPQ